MRLALAGIPAALITLVLFILMQAMVASPERIPGHGTTRNPVAFVSPFAPARDRAPAVEALPTPAALLPPPPLPDFAPPPVALPAPSAPTMSETAAPSPAFPLDLGQLVLPPPPPARTQPARRPPGRQAPPPAVQTLSPAPAASPATSAKREVVRLSAPAMPPGAVAVDRAELASEGGRQQAGDVPIEAVPVVRVEPEYPRKAARAGREGRLGQAGLHHYAVRRCGQLKA